MIELKGITKTYISKSHQAVDALKNVDFALGNTGMVFVLGKSGSGKSTLLNLLGGLDAPTEGEIVVDGTSMQQFTRSDYDSYRNGYVGFIFQEYNLLKDFSVKDNVALALQLRGEKNTDESVVAALEQVELSSKYLHRRVSELSGGEKQRIAIARCIVKDSKMVLADEPTGNLDSATGNSIWNILKKLSQTRLVVVVSHDRESAEKYADRIIEISDGQVIADNGTQQAGEENVEPFKQVKKGLPFRTCLKMGINNTRSHKVKTVAVILVTIFSMLSLLMTQIFACFSPSKTLAKFVREYDIPYVILARQYARYDDKISKQEIIRIETEIMSKALEYLSEHADYFIDETVESKQQLLNFGFSFVGEAQELNAQSFYVTSDALERILKWDMARVLIDGELVQVEKDLHSTEFLIGKQVDLRLFQYSGDSLPILAGVVDSDAISPLVREYAPMYFATSEFESNQHDETYNPQNSLIYVKTPIRNMSAVFDHMADKLGYDVAAAGFLTYKEGHSGAMTDVAGMVSETGNSMLMFVLLAGALCIVMMIILVLLVINLISFNIADRKREIGILSALGASNADVTKIFIFEVLVIAAICFVLSMILTFGFAIFANTWFAGDYVQQINFLRVDIVSFAVGIVASFGLLSVVALIPLRKIATLNPIDAIRTV